MTMHFTYVQDIYLSIKFLQVNNHIIYLAVKIGTLHVKKGCTVPEVHSNVSVI